MSFSGGVYTLPGPALNTGEIVSASENNTFRNDVATAFNLTFLRNGTSTATANLPMGGYKLTGLGVATTSGDALSYGQTATVSDLTASGTVTISSGTANGVAYLNGSKVLTTGSALTFDGSSFSVNTAGNFIIGKTTGYDQMICQPQVTGSGVVQFVLNNAGSTYQPLTTDASYFAWRPNGSEQMRLTSTGLGIGTSSPGAKLHSVSSVGSDAARFSDNTNYTLAIRQVSGQNRGLLTGTAGSALGLGANNTEYAILDSSGNLGLGVTPSAWNSVYKATQLGAGASISGRTDDATWIEIDANCYRATDGNWKALFSGVSSKYQQEAGAHKWYTAGITTAGNAISFTQAMTLDANGYFQVGTTTNYSIYTKASILHGVALAYDSSNGGVVVGATTGGTELAYLSMGRNYNLASAGQVALATSGAQPILFGTSNTERMRIDSSGNVGIGTSSPAADSRLHIYGADTLNKYIRVENNNGTSYFGTIGSGSCVIESNTQTIFTTGSGYTERMRIDSSGNLLVGITAFPGGGDVGLGLCKPSTSQTAASRWAVDTTSSAYMMTFVNNNGFVGSIQTSGSATSFVTSSDYRLKENIQPMQNALGVVAQLNPVTYTWKADGSDGQGFIAHELQAVVPDCVTGEKDAVDADGNPVYQGIDTSFLVATLTKAIQEQQEQINQLKAEVAALKGN